MCFEKKVLVLKKSLVYISGEEFDKSGHMWSRGRGKRSQNIVDRFYGWPVALRIKKAIN